MTILFVDDDPDDYQLFCEALKSFEPIAKCLHVTDGQKALELLHNILPDYI
jgi:CheY-like chemotaxis protein